MATRVLTSLSPARRRFALAVAVLVPVVVAGAISAALLRQGADVRPVPQDRSGPVLLVPGYGGSTTSLEVLAEALEAEGRDVRIVRASGSGTGDLREAASGLADVVDATLAETGAPSVDIVGYSAGGVVLRLYVAELGGGSTVRRAVTLSAPHHGTDLAALGLALGGQACPVACQQLAPDSDLLRELNAGAEAPAGPLWVALWTEDDQTVVPPVSGDLDGAPGYAVQGICPGVAVSHGDMPRTPAVIAMVTSALGTPEPVEPDASVCTA